MDSSAIAHHESTHNVIACGIGHAFTVEGLKDTVIKLPDAEANMFSFDVSSQQLNDAANFCIQSNKGSERIAVCFSCVHLINEAQYCLCNKDHEDSKQASGAAAHVVDDTANIGWLSPRISFSNDLSMDEGSPVEAGSKASTEQLPGHLTADSFEFANIKGLNACGHFGSQASIEKLPGHLADFEFAKNGRACDHSLQTKDLMLSADKLFANGKLLPLHLPPGSGISPCFIDDLCVTGTSNQRKLPLQKPLARHLSFDICRASSTPPPPSSSSFSNSIPPNNGAALSSSSPPQLCVSSHLAPDPPMNHALPKAQSSYCYSAKIKEFFRTKRLPSSQLIPDNGVVSTCRLPISPRSLWPFSRSNSAGERKVTSTIAPLTRRSNSAGERNAARACCMSTESTPSKANSACNCSHSQGMADVCQASQCLANSAGPSQNSEKSDQCTNVPTTSKDMANKVGMGAATSTHIPVCGVRPAPKKKASNAAGKNVKSSSSRRGMAHTPAGIKTNAGKQLVLRNLERCSAENRLGREGKKRSVWQSRYPVAMKVAPVLNVALYKGKGPPARILGLNGLFSKAKNSKEAAVTNWRSGA